MRGELMRGEVAVIGGGPAGLRVLELALAKGLQGHLFEQKRSVGRKFLVAGKSGLNLTNAAEPEVFLAQYKGRDFPAGLWERMYAHFSNKELQEWAAGLGQTTFQSSGQKIFPEGMKAAPLLRALIRRLKGAGGEIHVNHALCGVCVLEEGGYELSFHHEGEVVRSRFEQVVLALGGASWSITGSDGAWVPLLEHLGIGVTPLQAANCGWEYTWSEPFLAEYEGVPWKNIMCRAGTESKKGELVITKYGLEGGPLYKLGYALRQLQAPVMEVDFKPDFTVEALVKKAESVRRNLAVELSQRWKVPPSVLALLAEREPEIFCAERVSVEQVVRLAELVKACPFTFSSARPVEEAISTFGGVRWDELDDDLMLKGFPNLYVCGEMVDWEAPTGGFLLQGCFTMASWIGKAL